jgi:hypothetical protein
MIEPKYQTLNGALPTACFGFARPTGPVTMSAHDVSVTHAVAIRAGRRRPHPRHWEALAELVGVAAAL